MIYAKHVSRARFVAGIKIPENAVYVRVTPEGAVWRAHNPKFYKDLREDLTLKKALSENRLTILRQ